MTRRKQVDFSHNPFSMPQGGLEALETGTRSISSAFQYDIVCNGVELSSGAIRNHRPDIMYKAFEIAGYSRADVDTNFSGMINAFKYGAPPHGGSAPGIDRIVMLLADEPNLGEVVLFPMNQRAEDLMMGAPGGVSAKQLRELHIRIVPPSGTAEKDPSRIVAQGSAAGTGSRWRSNSRTMKRARRSPATGNEPQIAAGADRKAASSPTSSIAARR